MKYSVAILLLALIAMTTFVFMSVRAEDEDDFVEDEADDGIKYSDSVITLTDANFDEMMKKHSYILVEFYASWCPHCKNLAPEISSAADQLAKDSDIKIGTLECDQNNEKCSAFNIPGFPTLKLFKDGEPWKDFEEGRQAADIVNWLKRKTGPAAVPLADKAAVDAFVAEQKTAEVSAVVGSFKNKDSDLYKNFIAVANENDDFVFAEFVGAEADTVQVYQYFSDEPITAEATDVSGLATFINANGFPLVDEINAKTFKRFAEAGIPLAVFFMDYKEDMDNKPMYMEVLNAAAQKLQGKVNIGYSDGREFEMQLVQMGGETEGEDKKVKLPQMAAMNIETRMNYPYKGEIDVDAIVAWGEGVVDGSVKPYLKSQAVPEKNDGPVRVIVGSTFEDEVLNSDKDVMVMFYAEWCGHCKSLKPKYEKLGEYFQDIEGVVVAKMDATENDQTAVQIEGFPTLYFFKAGAKDAPVSYEGERTQKALKKFIFQNASKDNKAAIKAKVKAKKEKKDEL